MSRSQDLHPDQQAVLQLVLRRRMAYAEIGGVLGLPPEQVRERALDAVDGLAPDDVPGLDLGDRDRIADLLLGQASADERDATRALVRDHPPARTWADRVAAELAPLGGPVDAGDASGGPADGGPPSPSLTDAAPAAAPDDAPRAAAGAPAASSAAAPQAAGAAVAAAAPAAAGGSGDVRDAFAALDASNGAAGADAGSDAGPAGARRGSARSARGTSRPRPRGRTLLAGLVALLAAAAVIAWVSGAFDGGDPDAAPAAAAGATTTEASGTAQDAAAAQAFLDALPRQINFRPPAGAQGAFADVKGVAQSMLSQSSGEPVLALTTEGVPKATSRRRYFAWADKKGADPILIGQLTDARGAELPFTGVDLKTRKAAAVDPTVYDRIRVTRQTAEAPTRPGPTVLVGTLSTRPAAN